MATVPSRKMNGVEDSPRIRTIMEVGPVAIRLRDQLEATTIRAIKPGINFNLEQRDSSRPAQILPRHGRSIKNPTELKQVLQGMPRHEVISCDPLQTTGARPLGRGSGYLRDGRHQDMR